MNSKHVIKWNIFLIFIKFTLIWWCLSFESRESLQNTSMWMVAMLRSSSKWMMTFVSVECECSGRKIINFHFQAECLYLLQVLAHFRYICFRLRPPSEWTLPFIFHWQEPHSPFRLLKAPYQHFGGIYFNFKLWQIHFNASLCERMLFPRGGLF